MATVTQETALLESQRLLNFLVLPRIIGFPCSEKLGRWHLLLVTHNDRLPGPIKTWNCLLQGDLAGLVKNDNVKVIRIQRQSI